jgi:hypothetical protein
MGPLPEFRQAQKRVAGAAWTLSTPTHVPGTDPKRSRARVEQMA